MTRKPSCAVCSLLAALVAAAAFAQTGNLGVFTSSADVGDPSIRGSAEFSQGQYRITGSGSNIWGKRDQFHYVWREMTGNFALSATIRFLGQGNEHRKAGLMVRQSLDPDARYADVLIHGNGMPALQWRNQPGEDTNTFDLPSTGPASIKLKMVRDGVKIYLYLAQEGADFQKIANTEVAFQSPVLAGLVVCAHQANAAETVLFSDVSVEATGSPAPKTQTAP